MSCLKTSLGTGSGSLYHREGRSGKDWWHLGLMQEEGFVVFHGLKDSEKLCSTPTGPLYKIHVS